MSDNQLNNTAAPESELQTTGVVSPIELPDTAGRWIKRTVYGALVGVGAILPGVSGGAFCAAFGIYRPMMDFFAHPFRNFKKNVRFFLPFVIGCALGFILLSGLVNWLINLATAIVTAFFVGCIAGTMPSLYKEANGKSWRFYHWLILVCSTALTTFGLLSMSKIDSMQRLLDDPNSLTYLITWVVCGVVFALGSIVPGMSPSSLIMYADLYEPMTAGIAALKLNVLLPLGLGGLLCIVLFSKLISWLFEKAGSGMFSFIIGVVIASTALVAYKQVIIEVMTSFSWVHALSCVGSAIVGYVLVILLAKLDPR